MWPNPRKTADLVTFTEEILNCKPHFSAVPERKLSNCDMTNKRTLTGIKKHCI